MFYPPNIRAAANRFMQVIMQSFDPAEFTGDISANTEYQWDNNVIWTDARCSKPSYGDIMGFNDEGVVFASVQQLIVSYPGGVGSGLEDALYAKQDFIVPGAHIDDVATDAVDNLGTTLNESYSALTILTSLITAVNTTNMRVNQIAVAYNDLATKHNDLSAKYNTLLAQSEAQGLIEASAP